MKHGIDLLRLSRANTYRCGCGTKHEIPMYAFAQQAMGNSVQHHCPGCGRRNVLLRSGLMVVVNMPFRIQQAVALFDEGEVDASWRMLYAAARFGQLPEPV